MFASILQFLFKGHESPYGFFLSGECVLELGTLILELGILIPQFVDILIHDADILCLLGATLPLFLVLLTGSRRLLFQSDNVLVEQLDLLGVRLN